MLIQNFHSLYSKISHRFWHQDREFELEFDFYCHFYNMTRKKFQISRIRIYYFRWFQLDLETLKMSQGFGLYLSDSRVWLLKKSMPCCCHDSPSRWLQAIFPCCTTLLCDSFNPSVVRLNILFTANFMGHWDLFMIPAKPRHIPMRQHTHTCTVHLGTLSPSASLWLSFPLR